MKAPLIAAAMANDLTMIPSFPEADHRKAHGLCRSMPAGHLFVTVRDGLWQEIRAASLGEIGGTSRLRVDSNFFALFRCYRRKFGSLPSLLHILFRAKALV